VKCGVAYDFQLLEEVPTEPHDVRVNFVITPNRCVRQRVERA
jgi:5-formyltetrahydrofolate cyclo-ligase